MSVFVKRRLALEVKHLTFQMYEKKSNWIDFPWKGKTEKTIINHEAYNSVNSRIYDADQCYCLFAKHEIQYGFQGKNSTRGF
jgi:hypothetical protein